MFFIRHILLIPIAKEQHDKIMFSFVLKSSEASFLLQFQKHFPLQQKVHLRLLLLASFSSISLQYYIILYYTFLPLYGYASFCTYSEGEAFHLFPLLLPPARAKCTGTDTLPAPDLHGHVQYNHCICAFFRLFQMPGLKRTCHLRSCGSLYNFCIIKQCISRLGIFVNTANRTSQNAGALSQCIQAMENTALFIPLPSHL